MGIRDLCLKYPSILERNLGTISGRLSEIMLDGNSNVRQALYVTLNALLPKLKEEIISPFFSLFINYMMAGVTHLSSGIRQDSLQIIILFLRHHCNLVVQQHFKFLPQFISLISQKESTSKSAIFRISKQPNPNRKSKSSESLKSKYSLIECLNILLQGIIKNTNSNENNLLNADYRWEQKMNILLYTGLQPSYSLDSILGTTQNIKTSQEELYNLFKENNIAPFISMLYPSLIGLIIECELDSLNENVLSHLRNLINIIYNLALKLNQISNEDSCDVKRNLLTELAKYIMPYFPLSSHATWSDESNYLLTKLNISITKIMTLFLDESNYESDWVKAIIDFIIYIFPLNQYKFSTHLLSVIKRLLMLNMNNSKYDIFLKYLTDYNEQDLPTLAAKRKYINLIYDLIMSHIKLPDNIMEKWLSIFPTTLLSLGASNFSITNDILVMISNICVQLKYTYPSAHDILQQTMYKFFWDSDENSTNHFIELPMLSQRLAIEVLAQLNKFSLPMIESIINCLNSSKLSTEVTNYLLESINDDQFSENLDMFKQSIKING